MTSENNNKKHQQNMRRLISAQLIPAFHHFFGNSSISARLKKISRERGWQPRSRGAFTFLVGLRNARVTKKMVEIWVYPVHFVHTNKLKFT